MLMFEKTPNDKRTKRLWKITKNWWKT